MIEIRAEWARFNTSKIYADKARLILKKGLFSGPQVLEIFEQVNRKENQWDSSTWIEIVYTEKQESPNWIEMQNNENRNTTDFSTTKHMLTEKDTITIELLKKIMIEKKTTLPFLRNQTEKFKAEKEIVTKLWPQISPCNITEPTELIFEGTKRVCDEILVPLQNSNRNTKPAWEIRIEGLVNKFRQQSKILRKE